MNVFVTIGNSDNRLSQADWARFARVVDDLVRENATEVHGAFVTDSVSPWQSACWSFEIAREEADRLRVYLALIARDFQQDSIAWNPSDTEFITPTWQPSIGKIRVVKEDKPHGI